MHWPAITGQIGSVATVLIISVVSLLLNASGLELIAEKDTDLNRELQVAGLGTFCAGLGGSMVGYHALSLSALGYKLGASSRLVGLFSAGLCGVTLFLGASALAYFPKVIVGSLLLLLGLSFLIEWVYETWFKFPKVDYFIIILILVVIATVGFLEGVGVGLVTAVILFVIDYSRIDVVKQTLSGTNYQSRVTRSRSHRQLLWQNGEQLYILQLQGFIFFGTADSLLGQVRHRFAETDLSPLRFVLLDFRQVIGLDSTAMLSFTKMKQLARAQNFSLLFTQPSPKIRWQLEQGGFAEEVEGTSCIFPDFDHGLEWCENQTLLAAGVEPEVEQHSLQELLEELLPQVDNVAGLLNYLEQQTVDADHYLMHQGDPPEDLYFIETGQVTARLEVPGQEPVRLETMEGGRVVGEIGFYLGNERTAAVVANKQSTVYRLSRSALEQMEGTAPEIASTFHQIIVHLVSERLTHLISTVQALER
ncbi:MAG: SLC26A/SulP transporter family protein [Chloroflexi bacterium]|nr:SLC26A/SulP transporter family protein [Chloroflexota bacterium]